MTKRIIALLGGLLVALVSSGVYAGFYHTPGGDTTYDAAVPGPATFWNRQQKGNARGILWPAAKPIVFPETTRYYNYYATATNSTAEHKVAFGFWRRDASGISWPHNDLADAVADDDSITPGGWHDVEWELDDRGILWPKE